MFHDAHGPELTVALAKRVEAFDRALTGYLCYRDALPRRMAAKLQVDSDFGMAHCLKAHLIVTLPRGTDEAVFHARAHLDRSERRCP